MCDNCKDKETCPFYESGEDTCVYEVLARMAKEKKDNESKH